jgi:hypothetical protein
MTSGRKVCYNSTKTAKIRQISLKFLAAKFHKDPSGSSETVLNAVRSTINSFTDEAQTALFKDPVRTAL